MYIKTQTCWVIFTESYPGKITTYVSMYSAKAIHSTKTIESVGRSNKMYIYIINNENN